MATINVEYDSLSVSAQEALACIKQMEDAAKSANNACNSAIGAFGGEETKIGKALAENIGLVDANAFNDITESITNISTNLTKVSNEYAQQESNILSAILNASNGGGTPTNSNVNMIN